MIEKSIYELLLLIFSPDCDAYEKLTILSNKLNNPFIKNQIKLEKNAKKVFGHFGPGHLQYQRGN